MKKEWKMIRLENENSTVKLGEIIADTIPQGIIIALTGELGSGKTTLSQSIIKNMMKIQDVSSPTFNIVNEYRDKNQTIYHFDFYRLEDESELFGIGFDDYLSDKKSIMLIEWADKFLDMLPKNYLEIVFYKGENHRDVEIKSVGKKYVDVGNEIIEKFSQNKC
jgi:hydrolase, P-loop family